VVPCIKLPNSGTGVPEYGVVDGLDKGEEDVPHHIVEGEQGGQHRSGRASNARY